MNNIVNAFLLLMVNSFAFAQIGVNITEPKATFDINAKNTTGTSGLAEGLLIPRVDRQRAQSMTQIPVSTLLYINDITTGTQIGTTINIDEVGYYSFDGGAWVKINADHTMYTTDGVLTDNRILSQGANKLSFTANTNNAFSVDGATFSIDAENNRVGIGTSAPTQTLDLEGTLGFSQTVAANRPTSVRVANPIYIHPTTGLLTTAPKGSTTVSGGLRPGQNYTIASLPISNTIARVRFVCYVDNSSNSNNGIGGSYTYGDFTVIGTGTSNPIHFIDVNIKGSSGNSKPLNVNTPTAVGWDNVMQGNSSIRLNQSTGALTLSNTQQVMSYFFEIIGGT
ncbi:hypothetical protein [Chryseobacterium sp. ERMR1:04]|uniref:hypothetical protein n=1 Tax=Chryseobacterium sp. ERMR1:04 TaxID=1705393 RepID=UPI000AECF002|nr:hypothetical protein [Chryseobacterium sp. ERMR1:04]